MTYNYSASASTSQMSPAVTIVSLIISVLMIIGMWKMYVKAGKPGWASIVPFYNLYVLFEIAGMNGWMFLLLLVPIANIVFLIILYINLAKAFGKSGGFAAGLILLTPIFMLILGFGSDKYIGVSK